MLINKGAIRSQDYNLIDFATSKKLIIPLLQRSYVWKAENLYDIFREIKAYIQNESNEQTTKESYFMTIMAYKDFNGNALGDGQQRLITFNMLLHICRSFYLNDDDVMDPLKADQIKIFDIEYKDKNLNKKYNNTLFGKKPEKPFKDTYIGLCEFVQNHKANLDTIVQWTQICTLTAILADQEETLYEYFERQNAGGVIVDLKTIIKNSIQYYAEQYHFTINDDILNDIIEFVKSYSKVKQQKKIRLNAASAARIVNTEILTDNGRFGEFLNYSNRILKYSNCNLKYLINKLKKKELNCIIDAWIDRGENPDTDKDFQKKVFFPLFNIYAFSALMDKNPSGTLNAIIDDTLDAIVHYNNVDQIHQIICDYINKNKTTFVFTKEEAQRYFNAIKDNKDNIFMAFELEAYLLNNPSISIILKASNMTLEHVYPQNPHQQWANMGGYPINDEEQKKIIYSFGNMCILPQALNSSVQNHWIEDKVEAYNAMIDASYRYSFNQLDDTKLLKFDEAQNYIKQRTLDKIEYMSKSFPICDLLFI